LKTCKLIVPQKIS